MVKNLEQKWTNIEYIESKENRKYKLLKKLSQKKYRDLNNIFIAEGEKFIKECKTASHCIIPVSYTHLTLPTNREV